MKTVIAAFSDRAAADQAVRELRALHFIEERNIDILEGDPSGHLRRLLSRRVPEDRAQLYAEILRQGAPVVVIDCDDRDATQIGSSLDERGSLDLDSPASRWRTMGWQGYAAAPREHASTFLDEEYVVTTTAEVPIVEKQRRSSETIEETERRRDVEVGAEKLRES